MNLKTNKNNILFRFLDQVNNKGEFVREKTAFGLELLAGFDNSAKQPRWCQAVEVGSDVENIKAGDWFLLPPLRWTERVVFDGQSYWKTAETEVVCVRATPETNNAVECLNNFVLFTRTESQQKTTASGLFVVGNLTDNTATGQVLTAGPDADEDLVETATIYFNSDNFFDDVTDRVSGRGFSFIRDENILAFVPAGE